MCATGGTVTTREESASPLFKIIAMQFQEMATLFEALSAEDQHGDTAEPESPQGDEAERPVNWLDIGACYVEGLRARRACREAGGSFEVCYTTGRLAEAECLRGVLKAPEDKK
jgi:hypothetical protein